MITLPGIDPYGVSRIVGVLPALPMEYEVVEKRRGEERVVARFSQIAPIDVADLMAFGFVPWGWTRTIRPASKSPVRTK